MDFEGYEIATKHWLDGNEKRANELVEWMRNYTNKTPFDSPDLFPALARGIGVADGNVKEAKELLKISTDMAALTPNRTVEDAMEALADASMGEFQTLKSFNVKMTQEDFAAGGGWEGFLSEMVDTFEGGAEEFSSSARGLTNKLTGYITASFREAGDGILEAMKPRLESMSTWIDNNQDKWMEWRDTVQQAGEQAGDWVFTKLEGAFSYLRDNYLENDEFKNLDFEGKVSFIMDDLGDWWDKTGRPLMVEVSKDVGEAIFKGVTWGLKEGFKGIGSMWTDAFKDPSVGSFASAGIATAIGASIVSLLVSPLIKAFRIGKSILWDAPKWLYGLLGGGKGKGPRTPGGPVAGGRKPKAPKQPKRRKPDYRQPWFNRGTKPELNTPNKKAPKGLSKSLSKLGNFGKRIPVLGTALGGLSLLTAPKDEMAGTIGGIGGGMGGASAGAAIGSIFPGIGTAIGGIIGGIIGSISGTALGDWFGDNWSAIKEGASDTGAWISEKFSDAMTGIGETLFSGDWWSGQWGKVKELTDGTMFSGDWWSEKWSGIKEMTEGTIFDGDWWSEKWNGITETLSESIFSGDWWSDKWNGVMETASSTFFSAGWWAEQAGFIYGYLEETLFNGDWWGEKWDNVKEWSLEKIKPIAGAFIFVKDKISETIFSGDWWSEQWGKVKEMTAGTIFDGEWWSEKWQGVMGWTSEKWESAQEIWNNVRTAISDTILNGEWWQGKWESVKGWTQEKWDSAQEIWTSVKMRLTETIFSGEWWKGKWESVKGWTQSKWDSAQEIWNSVTTKINETIFSGEWWKGKWDSVTGWASEKWEGAQEI